MDDKKYRKIVGNNIKEVRLAAGFRSARKLAEHLSFTHDKLSRIERGESSATFSDLKEIATVLNIPVRCLAILDKNRRDKLQLVEKMIEERSNLKQAEMICQELINTSHECLSAEWYYLYNLIGKTCYFQGKYEEALEHWNKSLIFATKLNDLEYKFTAYKNIVIVLWHLERLDEALHHLEYCKSIATDIEQDIFIKDIECLIYVQKKEYDKPLEIYHELLKYYTQINNIGSISRTLHNIADIYERIKQIDLSIEYYEKAWEKAKESQDKALIARTAKDLSKIYFDLKKIALGKKLVKESMRLLGDFYSDKAVSMYLYYLQYIYDNQEKIAMLEKIYSIIKDSDYTKELLEISKYLARLYREGGDYQKAITYYENYIKYAEKLLGGVKL
jgi:tetratricopeptide (TPR) repeat protein